MEVVISGTGTTGRSLIEAFLSQNANIIIIDTHLERINFIKEHYDVLTIHGDCLSHYDLRRASVATCDIYIAATRRDSVNLVSCQLAKRLGAKYCVSRIFSDEIFPNDILDLESHLGINWLISPNKLAASTLTSWIRSNANVDIQNYFAGRLNIVQISPPPKSSWYKKPLESMKLPPKTKMIGYFGGENRIKRNFDHILFQGEKVILAGVKEGIVKVLQHHYLGSTVSSRKNIYIAGVDRVIMSTLQSLNGSHQKITIFEKNKATCESLQPIFHGTIIYTDYTDIEYLKQQNIQQCKTFICGSTDDAENLLTALNAQQLGIPNVISIVNHSDKYALFKRLNIDVILPSRLIAQELLRYFNFTLKEDFSFIADTPARAINKFVDKGSQLIGKDPFTAVKAVDEELEVIALWRQATILMQEDKSSHDIRIQQNDKILIASLEGHSKALKKIFKL